MASHALTAPVADAPAPSPKADPVPPVAAKAVPQPRYLFGPVIDFLCLGGSSLLLFPLVYALGDSANVAGVAVTMLLVAHFINHPHFAASYQIFYRGFAQKAFTPALGRAMQARYLFAGLIAPVALVLFFLWGAGTSNSRMLGYAANVMGLAVGWHYVKQGYGMLMVDAALKRLYLKDPAKKIILANCYMTWFASWLGLNAAASRWELWGLAYYSFAVPTPLVTAATAAAGMTALAAAWVLASEWRRMGSLPWNGVIAFGVSLYAWLLFVTVNPVWGLMVPALHSLQYLVVVTRFQLNYERDQLTNPDYKKTSLVRRIFGGNPLPHLAFFFVVAAIVGWLGFWGMPTILDGLVPYDSIATTGTLFLFVFWIFINVHHYFLDNVMWRRENPETGKYLFG
ncbi:hypothetical protein GCM10022280_23960 [Sphingomonas swuensis]|uniref:Uncharacterized protein n=1 Tax=Sphingomonas swuensis TaxID=977800 RepID=A0ABP7T8A2_9SPHN